MGISLFKQLHNCYWTTDDFRQKAIEDLTASEISHIVNRLGRNARALHAEAVNSLSSVVDTYTGLQLPTKVVRSQYLMMSNKKAEHWLAETPLMKALSAELTKRCTDKRVPEFETPQDRLDSYKWYTSDERIYRPKDMEDDHITNSLRYMEKCATQWLAETKAAGKCVPDSVTPALWLAKRKIYELMWEQAVERGLV